MCFTTVHYQSFLAWNIPEFIITLIEVPLVNHTQEATNTFFAKKKAPSIQMMNDI